MELLSGIVGNWTRLTNPWALLGGWGKDYEERSYIGGRPDKSGRRSFFHKGSWPDDAYMLACGVIDSLLCQERGLYEDPKKRRHTGKRGKTVRELMPSWNLLVMDPEDREEAARLKILRWREKRRKTWQQAERERLTRLVQQALWRDDAKGQGGRLIGARFYKARRAHFLKQLPDFFKRCEEAGIDKSHWVGLAMQAWEKTA